MPNILKQAAVVVLVILYTILLLAAWPVLAIAAPIDRYFRERDHA